MDSVLRPLKGCDAGELCRRVDAGVAVDREADDLLDQRVGPHREAKPPTGHRIGLGPAIEQDQPVAAVSDSSSRLIVLAPIIQHLAVDLVRQQRHVRDSSAGRLTSLSISSFGTAPPVGLPGVLMMISRVCRCDLGENFLSAEGKAVLFTEGDRHRLRADVFDHRAIDREARVRIHDLGARPPEHQDREEHRRLAAGHDDDRAGIDLDAVALIEIAGNRLPSGWMPCAGV